MVNDGEGISPTLKWSQLLVPPQDGDGDLTQSDMDRALENEAGNLLTFVEVASALPCKVSAIIRI